MDLSTLDAVLKANVIGQSLAVREIVDALGTFYNRSADAGSPVLVLYLLGWLGTGKTLTATLLRSQVPIFAETFRTNIPMYIFYTHFI
jgi:ATP-dependent Clp protease ATP-binding subunit ClpA